MGTVNMADNIEVKTDAIIQIPREEWELHRQRVESLIMIMAGVLEGASRHPLLGSMVPPEMIAHLHSLRPEDPNGDSSR